MNDRGFPSMTALLALLAVAGYQNRDKIAEMIRGATQGAPSPGTTSQNPPAGPQGRIGETETSSSGLGGLLGGLFGGGTSGSTLQDGLSELVNRFRQTGHDEVDSWVGNGQNRDIDDRNLEHAIGPDVLATLSRQTGLSREELLARLTRTLPQAVDAFTPNGRLGDA